MALGSQNFSVEGVKNLLSLGKTDLNRVQSELYSSKNQFDVEIDRLNALIEQVIQREADMLALLGCDSKETFKTRLIDFYAKSGMDIFAGLNLRQKFIEDFQAEAKTIKQQRNIDEIKLAEYIVQQLANDPELIGLTGRKLKKELNNKFHGTMTAKITETGTRFAATLTDKFIVLDDQNIPHVAIKNMTPAILNRLQSILAQINGGKGSYTFLNQNELNVLLQNYNLSQNTLTIYLQSKWLEFTKGMTATDIRKAIKNNPRMKQVRDDTNKKLINYLVSQVNVVAQPGLRTILQQMVRSNPEMFYIGVDEKQLTGLLGEAAAYTALTSLFPGKFSFQWVAQKLYNGRQLSADFLLKEGLKAYGIQVKNSAQVDLSNLEIGMMSPTNIDTVFQRLHVSQNIGNALESSHFNLSYQIDNEGNISGGSNSVFDPVQAELEAFKQEVHTFLIRFAPEMLYIQNEERTDRILANLDRALREMGVSGNILYIVAGRPFFASDQLEKIKEQIKLLKQYYTENRTYNEDELTAFHIKENGGTIVDYLNARRDKGLSVKLADFNTKLTSSMVFTR